jgi:hypothetical protein
MHCTKEKNSVRQGGHDQKFNNGKALEVLMEDIVRHPYGCGLRLTIAHVQGERGNGFFYKIYYANREFRVGPLVLGETLTEYAVVEDEGLRAIKAVGEQLQEELVLLMLGAVY